MKSLAAAVAASLAFAMTGTAANAQISDDVVKIGVLTDMSSLSRRSRWRWPITVAR
jgi:branched-chain amino acid transport system substrate-binding protein